MKQITFNLSPGDGAYLASAKGIESNLNDFLGTMRVQPGSVVVTDVPDPEIVQVFEIRRAAIYGPITADIIKRSLMSFAMSVREITE